MGVMQIPGSQQMFGELQGLPVRLQLPLLQEPVWQVGKLLQKLPLVFRLQLPFCVDVTVLQESD